MKKERKSNIERRRRVSNRLTVTGGKSLKRSRPTITK
uniref:Uncharacterized protein n=1 Tax=Anopheles minimus TaxID=112268 RepID=A0A182WQ20_9DIPT